MPMPDENYPMATLTIIGGSTDTAKYTDYEIGPGQWFIKDYFLHVRLAWTTIQIHVGDVKADETKSLKFRVEIPL